MDHHSLVSFHSGLTMLSRGRKLLNILDVLEAHRTNHPHRHAYLNGSNDSGNGEGGKATAVRAVSEGGENSDSDWDLFDFDNAEIDIADDEADASDETDGASAEETGTEAKVDTQIVHKNLDIPEMAELIHRVCEEWKQPERELTVVHYVAVDEIIARENLCNAVELSNAELPCRHVIVQQVIEGEMLEYNNTSRVSAMLQFLFRMKDNDVVIFEHVDFGVSSTLDLDDYRSLAYSFNGEHNQNKRNTYLNTCGDIVMCNAVQEEVKHKQNAEKWRRKWTTAMQERQQDKKFDKWGNWGRVNDLLDPHGAYVGCLTVRTLKSDALLQHTSIADAFLANVIYGVEEDINTDSAMSEVLVSIKGELEKYDRQLVPSFGRFQFEFKDICPAFKNTSYTSQEIETYNETVTVSFANYESTVSVLKNFLRKKLLSKKQREASFVELYMKEDKKGEKKFDSSNEKHVKSFMIMCYNKAAWFKKNHQKLLHARYMLKWYCKKKGAHLKSWAKWLLFVVEQIIVMSNFAQSAWKTLDHNLDAEKTIAFKQTMDPGERRLLGKFREALIQTANPLFPPDEGEVNPEMGAFQSIQEGLELEAEFLIEKGSFKVGNKRKKRKKRKERKKRTAKKHDQSNTSIVTLFKEKKSKKSKKRKGERKRKRTE